MYRMILKNIFDKFFHILTLEIIFFCQLEMFLWNLFKKIFKKNLKVHNIKKKIVTSLKPKFILKNIERNLSW